MLITRENEYAIRMVRALADKEIKTVKKICYEERVPLKWAYKILKKMEYAKIVKAFHGVNGGYRLDREISQITMLDILSINENALRFSECAHGPSCADDAHSPNDCAVTQEFMHLQSAIKSVLNERTMDKVLK